MNISRLPRRLPPQTLMIDADDTLWENNIYFEHAIAHLVAFLDHRTLSPDKVRATLYEIETEHVRLLGYGLNSFHASLLETYRRLAERPLDAAAHATIDGWTAAIAAQPITLRPAVRETLQQLSRRHRLLLVTKGDTTQQRGKLQRSGLEHFFAAVEVLTEKDETSYRALLDKHQLNPTQSWMIGNSPKSDINPSLSAGLNAVLIPHPDTWALEHATLQEAHAPQQLLQLSSFAQLDGVF